MTTTQTTTAARIEYGALWLLAAFGLPVAVQATFTPQSFFDDFPLGRGWISADGALYNEHLVRDVGVLYLALVVATAWTAWRRGPSRPVAAAWLVQGVLHAIFHARHLHGFGMVEQVTLMGSLITVPMLAAIALWAGSNSVRFRGG